MSLIFENLTMMKHLIFLAILLLSCTEKQKASPKNNDKPDEHTAAENLTKIKDTTLFGNSAEGEAVELLINPKTKDSVIRSEALGETGKSEYLFIFNKTLKTAEVTEYRYAEPTSYNPKPKIVSKTTQTLSQSAESKKTLTEIFQNYRNIFAGKNLKTDEVELSQTADISEKNGNAFPKSGSKASDFLPKSGIYEIQYEAGGDLNGDGLEDLAVVMHSRQDNTATRPMLILLQNTDKTSGWTKSRKWRCRRNISKMISNCMIPRKSRLPAAIF